MTIYIASWHYRARVIVQRAWGWSPVEELVLLHLDTSPGSMESVKGELNLSTQVVGATFARLMQFGLIEFQRSSKPVFSTSAMGRNFIRSGRSLPERTADREISVSLVYERVGHSVFRRRDVTLRSAADIGQFDAAVRFTQDEPDETEETMAARVSEVVAGALRPGEWLRGVRAVNSVLSRRYLKIDLDEVRRDVFPRGASPALVKALRATLATGIAPASNPVEHVSPPPIDTYFDAKDIVIGSKDHLDRFAAIVDRATTDVFVLSTFVATQADEKGRALRDLILDALARALGRGVRCHLFFGTSIDVAKHRSAMEEIRVRLSANSLSRGFLAVHLDTVRSHAKFLVADDGSGRAVVMIGSCNWLSTPFSAVEVSVEIRENGATAVGIDLLRTIVRSLSEASRSVEVLRFMAAQLRRSRQSTTERRETAQRAPEARLVIVDAPTHERLLRRAAHEAAQRFVCCTNRIGATAVPALFTPAEIAGRRLTDVRIYYSRYNKPVKRKHVTEQRERLHGTVDVIPIKEPQLHCKFLLWDDDHIIISTLNWGSQIGSDKEPWDEIGIYLEGPQLAVRLLERIEDFLPKEQK